MRDPSQHILTGAVVVGVSVVLRGADRVRPQLSSPQGMWDLPW